MIALTVMVVSMLMPRLLPHFGTRTLLGLRGEGEACDVFLASPPS
jgi:hypothetical protein